MTLFVKLAKPAQNNVHHVIQGTNCKERLVSNWIIRGKIVNKENFKLKMLVRTVIKTVRHVKIRQIFV